MAGCRISEVFGPLTFISWFQIRGWQGPGTLFPSWLLPRMKRLNAIILVWVFWNRWPDVLFSSDIIRLRRWSQGKLMGFRPQFFLSTLAWVTFTLLLSSSVSPNLYCKYRLYLCTWIISSLTNKEINYLWPLRIKLSKLQIFSPLYRLLQGRLGLISFPHTVSHRESNIWKSFRSPRCTHLCLV